MTPAELPSSLLRFGVELEGGHESDGQKKGVMEWRPERERVICWEGRKTHDMADYATFYCSPSLVGIYCTPH